MKPELERRRVATIKTMERYRGKAFDWGKGITCVHLARFHLRNMGHKPQSIPRFRSIHGARGAMKERGWRNVSEMLDSMLPCIPAASMALGDLAAVEGEGMEAIFVVAGRNRAFGWHEHEEGPVICEFDLGAARVWRA